jgi:glycosyltransferase involved in cell wall biosynthesis
VKVSVIVPAYNAQKTIAQTLKALVEQNYTEPFEITVVNDGSSDQTSQIVRSFSSVKCIDQPNAGPAAARNQGAFHAKGEFLAFTDSDCVPHKDWLTCLMQGFKQSDIGVVMGSYGIANAESPLATCVYKEIIYRHEKFLPDFPKAFGSYNFCVKKSVFMQVGGFNISYRTASGEDNDLSYKILTAKWRIYFQRSALVDHYHPTRIAKYLKEQFRHGIWRVRMYASHPGMVKGDDYTFWKDILEVPWSALCLLGFVLSALGFLTYSTWISFFILPFLLFEIFFAHLMIQALNKDIFWGFIMFLRSFSRTLGFTTGILLFFSKKKLNKP